MVHAVNNSNMSSDDDIPSSVPSLTPSLLVPSSYPSSELSTNSSQQPTSFPSQNVSEYPSSRPTPAANNTHTFSPSSSPHAPYDIVQDITNPKKFNFVAMSLSLSLLLVVVAVTLYGFLQRYTIVRKKSKASRYRHLKATTPERMEMYFAEDVGSASDANAFTKNIYSVKSPFQKGHMELVLPVDVSTSQSFVQSRRDTSQDNFH